MLMAWFYILYFFKSAKLVNVEMYRFITENTSHEILIFIIQIIEYTAD